jgi:hypothetical protein
MPLPRHKVAAYHRARRKRLKAEAKAARTEPTVLPLGRPLTAKERRDDTEMERIEARGGSPEWDSAAQCRRDASSPPPPSPAPSTAPSLPAVYQSPKPLRPPVTAYRPPAPPLRPVAPPPPIGSGAGRSLIAVGGKPGRGPAVPGYNPDRAPLDPYSIMHRVNMVTMLQALAAQVDTNTREIAALKAAARREAEKPSFMQSLLNAFVTVAGRSA